MPKSIHAFHYAKDHLFCEGVQCEELARRFGTPLYVYSKSDFTERYKAYANAFRHIPHSICYSVKANSNLTILSSLAKQGAGFDVVSGGELERVLAASKTAAKKVVFSGVGKTQEEILFAIRAGILLFNIESGQELDLLESCADRARKKVNVALRVNPDVSADTHPYISTGLQEHKFGIPLAEARMLYSAAARSKRLVLGGVSAHIGSQIHDLGAFAETVSRLASLVRELRSIGIPMSLLDVGGGIGIDYGKDEPIDEFQKRIGEYAALVTEGLAGLKLHLILEPGRSIVARSGALITRVIYTKQSGSKRFAVTDAAMNDLLRPSLYKAHHRIVPLVANSRPRWRYDVVGPICESGDFFAQDRELPEIQQGDVLAVLEAGAYGMSLASNYNTRPRAAEVLVDGNKVTRIRKRERVADLLKLER
jgi:diaminopimelate decarboxylase